MRRLRIVLLGLAALAAAACRTNAIELAASPATPTSNAPTSKLPDNLFYSPPATPVPTPTVRSWDVAPPTGVAHVDAVVEAIVQRDRAALAQSLSGFPEPCTNTLGNFGGALCSPGMPVGTPVQAYATTNGGCEGATLRLDQAAVDALVIALTQRQWHLVTVLRIPPGQAAARSGAYWILMADDQIPAPAGIRVELDDAGIVGVMGTRWLPIGCGGAWAPSVFSGREGVVLVPQAP